MVPPYYTCTIVYKLANKESLRMCLQSHKVIQVHCILFEYVTVHHLKIPIR